MLYFVLVLISMNIFFLIIITINYLSLRSSFEQAKEKYEIENLKCIEEFKNAKDLNEQLEKIIKNAKERSEPKFLAIKDHRPKEGSDIFVWDAETQMAIASVYTGTEEIWKRSKDKESRYSHFIQLSRPI